MLGGGGGFGTQLMTAETEALGVETHVCEVQLLLLTFAELKVMALLAAATGNVPLT